VNSNLPPPLRPSAPGHTASESDSWQRRGSLSDFSDYESSDENTRNTAGSSRRPGRYYVDVSDDPDEEMSSHVRPKVGGAGKLVDVEDPFADPFA
jgi:seryl-tRNA synthetase